MPVKYVSYKENAHEMNSVGHPKVIMHVIYKKI